MLNPSQRETTYPIPWWVPEIGPLERELVLKVLDDNYINEGELTSDLERRLAKLVGSRFGVATSSGTAALFLSLAAIDVGKDDEVIVPDITFIATANAVTLAGARAIIVDIDPRTLNMDPMMFEMAITPRTKAVIPVHVSGRPANLPAILEIARKRGLFVIEDAAESLTSRLNGKCLGSFGDMGCLSFSANKTITTGQGGIVFTNREELYTRLIELKDQGRPTRGTGGDDHHPRVGYNFKLTNLQAAIGLGQLSYLEERTQTMKAIYARYADQLKNVAGFKLVGFDLNAGHCPQWTDAIVEDRTGLDRYLSQRQIYCRRFWHPLHRQPPYRQSDERFPNSCRLDGKLLWLPSAFTLTEEQIDTVCDRIKEYFKGDPAK